jgi:hypothetical protein
MPQACTLLILKTSSPLQTNYDVHPFLTAVTLSAQKFEENVNKRDEKVINEAGT